MEAGKKAKVFWGCLVCKNLKNSVKEERCSICGVKREPHRFGFSLQDVYYLCHVDTGKVFPQVIITRVTPPESTVTMKLPDIQDSLIEAVKEAVAVSTSISSDKVSSHVENNDERGRNEEQNGLGKKLDLYHKVMKNATEMEYDVVMGQFLPIGSTINDNEQHKEFKYIESMKKEKNTMEVIVKNTILSRVEESPHTKDINFNEDKLNEWKAKVPCSLCGFQFPPAQLLGNISNQSILNWFVKHSAPTDSKECKKMSLQPYETGKICLFCTQFFDENYTDTFDVETSANEELRSRRKKDKKLHVKQSNEGKVIEKLNEKIAIAALKTKKDTHGIRMRASQDEEVINAERILKLQAEQRKIKFHEAKEKFRKHKSSLGKKTTASRTQSASSLPSISNESDKKSKTRNNVGNISSRSAGSESKQRISKSVSDSKLKIVKKKRQKKSGVEALPSITMNDGEVTTCIMWTSIHSGRRPIPAGMIERNV